MLLLSAVRNYVQAGDAVALNQNFGDLLDRLPGWIEYKYFRSCFNTTDQLLVIFYSGVNNH